MLDIGEREKIVIAKKRPVELDPRRLTVRIMLKFFPVARAEISVFGHLDAPPQWH